MFVKLKSHRFITTWSNNFIVILFVVRTGPLTGRMESVPHSAALSRRSTESNFMNL